MKTIEKELKTIEKELKKNYVKMRETIWNVDTKENQTKKNLVIAMSFIFFVVLFIDCRRSAHPILNCFHFVDR